MVYLLDISGHDTNHLTDFKPDKDFVPVEWLWKGKIPTQFDEQFIKVAIKWSVNTTEGGEEYETILDKIINEGLFSYIQDPALKRAIEYNYYEDERRFGTVTNAWYAFIDVMEFVINIAKKVGQGIFYIFEQIEIT